MALGLDGDKILTALMQLVVAEVSDGALRHLA